MMNRLKKVDYRNYGVIIGFIFLCLVVTIAKPEFMSSRNILNLMRQTSVIGIMAAGVTLVIISGNFDISVGYICCFAGVITAKMLNAGINLLLVILVVLAAGALIGSLSGFAISVVNIPSMIATLGMGQVVYGALLLISGGYPTSISNPVMSFIGKEAILGIPVPIYFFVLSIVLVS